MNRETAIRKVLACLRLAQSSNPHEAASALRQARAMMKRYGLDDDAILAAEIHTVEAKTRHAGAVPPQSVLALANVIAEGFRCCIVIHRTWGYRRGKTSIVFHGTNADARIAAYSFDVLRRQMANDRLKHIRLVRKRANRERRGEEFAIGWVTGICRLFSKAELPEGRERALQANVKAHHGDGIDITSGRDLTRRGRAGDNDGYAGYNAGRNAKLHSGLDGEQQRFIDGSHD